ncbi:MAG TPA: enoyl-CoA hydratase-related protein [Acidimicrobiia bacterium]|nr:enoyl-CoA hydratase-related protein [Acidimicrobiia bacterium]
MSEDLRFEVTGRVAVITLHRPDRLNAITPDLAAHFGAAMAASEQDPKVRVIVITGAGRAFSAGADFSTLAGIRDDGGIKLEGTGREAPPGPWSDRPGGRLACTMAAALSKPVIAAVNGPAAGVGLVFALSADLRFASTTAKFVTSYAKLGLPAEYGIAWFLPRLVGHARAAELLFSARPLGAEEALAIGVVNRLVEPDRLLDETLEYAGHLATMSPRSLRAMKAQLNAASDQGLAAAIHDANQRMIAMTAAPDFVEGVAATMEKRAPNFADDI